MFSMVTKFESTEPFHDNFIVSESPAIGAREYSSKGISYEHLLNPSRIIEKEHEENKVQTLYDPDFLDDPTLKTGKHRTVLNLPGFRESIIPFVKAKELKEELNEQYRQRHPELNPSVTLTRIRKLKRNLLTIAQEADVELTSLALSYVLLDKILLKNQATKENLKLCGAVCLFLAVKFNDPEPKAASLRILQDTIENRLHVDPKDILNHEFEIFAKLSFSLFVDPKEVMPHSQRLCEKLEITLPSV